ncbi:MAG: 2-amino-4-hydroxy-6-hydroxymethyldihydropteridine diphosphokinase [Nitrospirae bacterium]|nr:MAG: 2-amino-4-hydroxy-6-hydroxymethyldihydropteridine diphosphokinase [Nitrospirota bacterium]
MANETIFIGLGSNEGDRLDFCERALRLLQLMPRSRVTGVSSYYETEPVDPYGVLGTGWFINGVVRMETTLSAGEVLALCQEIECSLGRNNSHRIGPRTIDLDLLCYGQHCIATPDLVVPHPRLHLRRFILVPFAEIAPQWRHPVAQRAIHELLACLEDQHQVRRLDVLPGSRYPSHPVTCLS